MYLSELFSSAQHNVIYNDVKVCHEIEAFPAEYLNNKLHDPSLTLFRMGEHTVTNTEK